MLDQHLKTSGTAAYNVPGKYVDYERYVGKDASRERT